VRTRCYFDKLWGDEWPATSWLEPYFRAPQGQPTPIQSQTGGGNFRIEGVDGTEHLDRENGRIDIELLFWTHPELGATLLYQKSGGGQFDRYHSKGDLRRRLEWTQSPQGTPLSVGLFVPIDEAWRVLKDFVETRGLRSAAIDWISSRDLPADTFPDPHKWKHLKISA